MKRFFLVLTGISFLCACGSAEHKPRVEEIKIEEIEFVEDPPLPPRAQPPSSIDSLRHFDTDYFNVPDSLLDRQYGKRLDGLAAFEAAWLINKELQQCLIVMLGTDHARVGFLLFDINDPVAAEPFINLEKGGERVEGETLRKAVPKYLTIAEPAGNNYFVSKNGFKLSDSKQHLVKEYGKPLHIKEQGSTEILSWKFKGDMAPPDSLAAGERLARNSFGYEVRAVFRNARLTALLLVNEQP